MPWPLTYFKLETESRKLSGYNVFMMHYHRSICRMEKKEIYSLVYGYEMNSRDDLDPTDSFEVDHKDIMRHGSSMWNDLDGDTHDCWKKRSVCVNIWPLFGQFLHLPREIGRTVPSMFDSIQYSMI